MTDFNPSLLGEWKVVQYQDQQGAMRQVIDASEVTVAFGVEGKISGSAGCNRYFCNVQIQEGSWTISTIGTTIMFCDEPGIMDQEGSFFRALGSVKSYHMSGDRLELRDGEGRSALLLVRIG
jgi:heat shock protein HslJ